MTRGSNLVVAMLATLALAACSGTVPVEIAGYSTERSRGIDQDISATHGAGAATLDNTSIGSAAPWRLNQRS